MRRIAVIVLAVAVGVALVVALWPGRRTVPAASAGPRLAWVFEAPRPGTVAASPCATPHAIFVAACHARGIQQTGAVYAVDPQTGKPKWVFDRNGAMLLTASTPLADDGRLYFGEGMHGSRSCRLQCLELATGHPKWDFEAGDHIEGGPTLSNGTIIFPAGNDGLYGVDAVSGAHKWNFQADLHIDSSPCVAGGRVYAGSGVSRRFRSFEVVCLDAGTGNPVWRTGVALPAWGTPAVAGGRVLIGLGNGRLTESAKPPETPAGELACLDALTGQIVWTFSVGDAVFGIPSATTDRLVFGCRDGNLYGVDLKGHEVFRTSMGGPVVAGVTAANGRVFAVSVPGRLVCLDPATGREIWRHELGRFGASPTVLASPVISSRRLYVAAEMAAGDSRVVSLFCFDLPESDH